jgi:Tol biopolymer transport system component
MKKHLRLTLALSTYTLLLIGCDSAEPKGDPDVELGIEDFTTIAIYPDWHPGGDLVAFVGYGKGDDALLERFRQAGSECQDNLIWLLDLRSREITPFTCGTEPVWHPDGSRLAFRRNFRIYEASFEDPIGWPISPWGSSFSPAYSPGGKYIVYASSGAPGMKWPVHGAFYTPSGGGETTTVFKPVPGQDTPILYPVWTHDDRLLYKKYIQSEDQVFSNNLSWTDERQLTNDKRSGDRGLDLSPDGSMVVFTKGNIEEGRGPYGTYAMKPDGSEHRMLFGYGGWPSFSPDGKRLVSYAGGQCELPSGELTDYGTLYLSNLDGSGRERLIDFEDWHAESGRGDCTTLPISALPEGW